MTTSRTDEPNGRMNKAAETLGDDDEADRNGTNDHPTPKDRVAASQDRWYYYHVSTP